MRSAPILVLLLLAAAAATPHAATSRDVHQRIARIVGAYGEPARVAAVKAYRVEGELFSAMRHEAVPTTRVFARPDRFKTLIDYAGGVEARIVDGRKGWRMAQGGPLREADGPMLLSMVLQAARCDLPWILSEREAQATLLEPREQDGVKLEGLEVALGDGLLLRVWSHPRTHLVVTSEGALRTGGAFAHFETRYSEFRDVDGVKFPFHEENFASGKQTGVTDVKRVIVNPKLAPDEFTPPVPPDSSDAGAEGRAKG